MSVSKNFAIRNGLEVKTNLLIADGFANAVGIGTSIINYKLHVNGGIGATSITVTDVYVSGASTIGNISGTNLTYTTGNLTTLNATNAVIITGFATYLSGSTLNYTGISTVGSLYLGGTQVISSGRQLQNIASLDATTTATIESAIANGPNTFTDLTVTGVSTLGVTSATQLRAQSLNVSGIGTITTLNGTDLNYTGVATIGTLNATNVTISGAAATNFTVYNNLYVGGIGTIATGNITNLSGTNLNYTGVSTLTNLGGTNLNYTGVGTVATLNSTTGTITNLGGTNLNYTGIGTIGTVRISSGIITATSGIVTYYGDGSKLTNILSGVGIATAGGTVGTGATVLDFRGAGISTVTVSAGIATINITGGGGGSGSVGIGSSFPANSTNGSLFYHIDYGRTFVYYDEVALGVGATAVWIDAAPFNQGGLFVSKYGDNMFAGLGVTVGSLTNPSIYFNGYTNSGFYSPAANEFGVVVSGTQRLNVNASGINVTGVATATSFRGSAQVGVATGGNYIGLATQFNFVGSGVSVTHAYDTTAGIATITFFTAAAAGGGSGLFNTGITSSVGYLVTNSMATAYTAPATAGNEHIIHSIHITNIDGTTSADISGQLYAGQYSIANTVPVPAGSSVELLKQPKILAPSETIQLQASANNALHATITIETKVGDTTYVGVGTDITAAATYTDLWTATANAMLQGILLANDDGVSDVKARVVWTDGSNNIQGYFAYDMTVPADATVEILEQPKYLPSGYKVRVYANQANRLEAILAARTIA